MEEALEILWTYARREPLDSNGETVVPTINNSIAAIRIIMRLEGWGSEKRTIPNKPTHNCSSRAGERFTQCNTVNNNSCCRELVARTDDSVCNSLIGAEDSTLGKHELQARASMGNDDDGNNYTCEAFTAGAGVGGEEPPFLYLLYTPFFYSCTFSPRLLRGADTFRYGRNQKANDHHTTPTW